MDYTNVNTVPISNLNKTKQTPVKKKKKVKHSCVAVTRIKKGKCRGVATRTGAGTYTMSKIFNTGDISEKYEYGLSDW